MSAHLIFCEEIIIVKYVVDEILKLQRLGWNDTTQREISVETLWSSE